MIMSFDFGPKKPTLVHTVLLYDSGTGQIKHVHNEVFFGNAKETRESNNAMKFDQNTIEKVAFELAKKNIGNDKNKIKALHLQNYEFNRDVEYIVDVNRS